MVATRFIGCYHASVGFSSVTQDRTVTTSLERDHGAKGSTDRAVVRLAGRLPHSDAFSGKLFGRQN
jgi:hypothetical protein